jgi:RND family efflux transporter MFP subunit
MHILECKSFNLIGQIFRLRIAKLLALGFFLLAIVSACSSGGSDEESKPIPRPVTYLVLEEQNPTTLTRLTGSVESWKMEKVGFQVEGRVLFVLEPGVEIEGNVLDENGNVLSHGTVIAELENERYRLKLQEERARVRGMRAAYERREKEYRRQASLLAEGATSQKRYEQAEAEYRGAEASLREAQRVAAQAEVDLRDTELYSPYNGQVSKVHVIPGGYVERGQPVATVQMMDPMKVEIAVSPETDRKINYNDTMKVHIDGYKEPVEGFVWLKDTVADAATRTFMVTLLLRNYLVEVEVPDELKGKSFHRTREIMGIQSMKADGKPPYMVEEEAIHQDEEGYFVWKVEGLSAADRFGDFNPVFTVRKVRIVPGESVIRYVQLLTYRELKDLGGLNPGKDLVTSELTEDARDGDTVFLSRKRWLLRPGELVHVDMHGGAKATGFYLPARSIMQDDTGQYVFVVSEGEGGEEQAKKVEVIAEVSIGDFRRIEPGKKEQLAPGMKLIVDGVHYLHDGDSINAFNEVEVSP